MKLDMIDKVMIGLFIMMFTFSAYMLYRNQWVYDARAEVIDRNMTEFYELKPYKEMMNDLFVWDIEKMKKEK